MFSSCSVSLIVARNLSLPFIYSFQKTETWITIIADVWLGIWGKRALLFVCFSLFKRKLESVIGALVIRQEDFRGEETSESRKCAVIVVMQFFRGSIQWMEISVNTSREGNRARIQILDFLNHSVLFSVPCLFFLIVVHPSFLISPRMTFTYSSILYTLQKYCQNSIDRYWNVIYLI